MDSHFTELRDAEIMRERIQTLNDMEPYVGRYYSQEHIRKTILQQSDDDIEQIDKQIADEGSDEDTDNEDQQQQPQND